MSFFIFILFLPTAVVAWTVFFLCWNGRQVPQPAVCAKCGHATGDQSGRLASTCAECGLDLTNPRAVRYFRRERTALMRAGLVVASVLVSISTFVPLAGMATVLIWLGPGVFGPPAPPPGAAPPAPAAITPMPGAGGEAGVASDVENSTSVPTGRAPADGGAP